MKRKRPIEIMNLSFLDIITSASGVFFYLVLLVITTLYFNTDQKGAIKLAVLFTELQSYKDSIAIQKYKNFNLAQEKQVLASFSIDMQYNIDKKKKKEKLLNELKKKVKDRSESLVIEDVRIKKVLEKTPEFLINGDFIRPAIQLEEPTIAWHAIVFLKEDSILTYIEDKTFFKDSLNIYRANNPSFESLTDSKRIDSYLSTKLSTLRPNNIVNVIIAESAFEFYPEFRDYLLSKNLKISLQFRENDNYYLIFSSTGWNPRPMY